MRPLGRTLIAMGGLRASLGAVILVSLALGGRYVALVCLVAFAIAQGSDHLDGWVARRYSKPSVAGYLQDSISDKLFHVGCLLGLSVHFQIVNIILWGLLAREFVVLGARVITPDINGALAQLRVYSIAYAALIRLGILSFFLALIDGVNVTIAATAGYTLLTLGLVLGGIGALAALKPSRRAGEPPPLEAELEPRL